MSYEEEKQDRKIEQLEIKIEWLQDANTNFVHRICNQAQEIERQAARIQELLAELASANVELMAAGEIVMAKDARIKELEDALAEYRKLGKTIAGKVPCLTLHGDCGRCSTQAREVCGALEQIAEGKIGPDASKPRSWQITDERKAALKRLYGLLVIRYKYSYPDETETLRAMLKEAEQ